MKPWDCLTGIQVCSKEYSRILPQNHETTNKKWKHQVPMEWLSYKVIWKYIQTHYSKNIVFPQTWQNGAPIWGLSVKIMADTHFYTVFKPKKHHHHADDPGEKGVIIWEVPRTRTVQNIWKLNLGNTFNIFEHQLQKWDPKLTQLDTQSPIPIPVIWKSRCLNCGFMPPKNAI